MSEKKFVKKLRTFGMSMKVPLAAIIIGAALIPLFLEAGNIPAEPAGCQVH